MAWTLTNPVAIGLATKKAHLDALWDNCDFFKIQHGTDGAHGVVVATSIASASITPSNLTASLPVFSDGLKKLASNAKTGTGSVVLHTSPTLVTPVLGAASATRLTIAHARSATVYGLTILSDDSLANNKIAQFGITGHSAGLIIGQDGEQTMTYYLSGTTGTGPGAGIAYMPGRVNMTAGCIASLPVFTDASINLVTPTLSAAQVALGITSAIEDIQYLQDQISDLTGAWTDYSATSTVVGWAAGFDKNIFYKVVGKIVFVKFWIYGTSNAATASFTIPFTASNNGAGAYGNYAFSRDNGSNVGAYTEITTDGSNKISVTREDGAAWVTSGDKQIRGQLFYAIP